MMFLSRGSGAWRTVLGFRFGSKADMTTPESGHRSARWQYLLWANWRHRGQRITAGSGGPSFAVANSTAQAMIAGGFTPVSPACQAKGKPTILSLRPPPVIARARYHNVLVRVPVVMRIDQNNVAGAYSRRS
jgi:hypothetical protein